ncbi:MAG: nickel pincer cofactor biosynthesis protein LarC [Treponema sp.]|jgi:uncharacterized protein (TIGR00299 family) protein|nr:nickel pincer cofactor biosynthesis protein LarC [Treponema sp.]
MKTLHFDCFAGISGDMTLGGLVDLGVDPERLCRELDKLGIPGWKLSFHRDERGGITGTHGVVDVEGQTNHIAHEHEHHSHHHEQEQVQDHPHEHNRSSDHHHNTWKEIRSLIRNSGIAEGAKKRALAIFQRIAEAEAQVHGAAEEDIGFHEVGALDSIIDIVGTAICLDLLKPDRITCGEIELGGGTVACAHGVLPVPAPATLVLVRGLPVKTGGFNKEMTTPTGAAILAASVDAFVRTSSFTEIKTGYGIGARKMEKPNVLRVSWREEQAASALEEPWQTEELVIIEANIDDMTGEALGFLMERLFEAGALDVTFTPCVMKKSRPGTIVSVLGSPEKLSNLRRTMFQYSATIGFREIPTRRLSLSRKESSITSDFGEVRQKTVFWGEKPLRTKTEYEDRSRIACEQGISLEDAERLLGNRGETAAEKPVWKK